MLLVGALPGVACLSAVWAAAAVPRARHKLVASRSDFIVSSIVLFAEQFARWPPCSLLTQLMHPVPNEKVLGAVKSVVEGTRLKPTGVFGVEHGVPR
jgi:hypothetical protein